MLHLHAGPPLEDEGGPRAHVCVPRDGGIRARVVPGGAGEDLVDDAEERNLDYEIRDSRWARWTACGLCEQEYHGVVLCALGWACWKTYVSRPEDSNTIRTCAIGVLAIGLGAVGRHEERLQILQTQLSTQMRLGLSEQELLATRCNIAVCLGELRREEEALALRRECYATSKRINNVANPGHLYIDVLNLSQSLLETKRYTEARSLLREELPKARRAIGPAADTNLMDTVLKLRWNYALSLCLDTGASRGDVLEATTLLEELSSTAQRVYGPSNPAAVKIKEDLAHARRKLTIVQLAEVRLGD